MADRPPKNFPSSPCFILRTSTALTFLDPAHATRHASLVAKKREPRVRTLLPDHCRLTDSFLRTICVLSLLLASTLVAFADGCYIPHKTYLQTPTIPAQTAIISFRDGQETLVVQSLLQAEGQEFGWIIPVPAPPTEMRVGTPGMIKTLQVQLQPRIIAGAYFSGLGTLIVISAAVTYWGLRTIYHHRNEKVTFASLLVFIFTFVILAGLSLPALGGSLGRFSQTGGITLANSQAIGHYDVATLKADSAQSLNNWLQANQLRTLDAAAQRIVNRYIREGWCFVTARLHRDGNQLAAPHPLVLTFPTKEPIYPMRLTALTGQPVHVELFLIGDRQWQSRDLTMQYSDQFDLDVVPPDLNEEPGSFAVPFRGATYRATLMHEQAKQLLWPGCIITKLVGDVSPKEMTQDYRFISVAQNAPYRAVVYSKAAAIRNSICIGLVYWCLGLVALILYHRKLINADMHRPLVPRQVALLFGFCAFFALANYLATTQAEVRNGGPQYSIKRSDLRIKSVVTAFLAKHPNSNGAELISLFEQTLGSSENRILGGKIVQEDSPGNFEVIERNGTTIIRLYREDGSYLEVTRPDPTPKESRR